MQGTFLAGTDEVGRGPLAGPVVAATVLLRWRPGLPPARVEDILTEAAPPGAGDSKRLTAKRRQQLLRQWGLAPGASRANLGQHSDWQLEVALAWASVTEIDSLNIHRASLLAMGRSFELLHAPPEEGTLLVDGKFVPDSLPGGVVAKALPKGDQNIWSIGVASIVAKEYRDRLMAMAALEHPGYGFERHAGYPTTQHKRAIARQGLCPLHRSSFRGVREHLQR